MPSLRTKRSNLAPRSGPTAGRDEVEILERHPLEKGLVLALREWPEDRVRLVAGIPVLAAAGPDGAGERGIERRQEPLGRGGGRRDRGGPAAAFPDQPHD